MIHHLNIEHLKAIIRTFSRAKVLVVGDIMLDRFVWGHVNRISPEAPVPVVEVHKESQMPGGSANVSANITSLKGQAHLCGLIGNDAAGQMLRQECQARHIHTETLITDTSRPTTVKDRIIAHSQQVVRIDREITTDISARQCQDIIATVSAIIPHMDLVIIEDYGKGMITGELIAGITAKAHQHKLRIAVDPKEKHFNYYKHVDVITPNHHEAGKATGITIKDKASLLACGEKLLKDLECEAVLITRGEQGMSLFQKDKQNPHSIEHQEIPTIAREVYDVSGAGDTVVATFSLALAVGATLYEAAYLSNLAGGIVVGKVGVATVSPEELEATLCKQLG